MNKITILGAGRVGEATAELLATKELCREVVLIDVREGAAAGAALDIQESASLFGFDTRVRGDTQPDAMAESDLLIVTAGLPRKPGMSRADVLDTNLTIIDGILDDMLRLAPDAKLLMVTNPVDVLTYHAWRRTGWDKRRVFGLSGVLDAARMAAFVCLETGFSAKDVTAMVLGGHGDAMVPLPRYTCINGIPLDHFLDQERIERIVQRTREGGAEILALKKTSSAYDAPAAAIAAMVDAIAHNSKRLLPCVAILEGEYHQRDIAMGVPSVLGHDGLERVIELQLTPAEGTLFERSAAGVRSLLEQAGGKTRT
jgi:malate dehydrogenase